MPPRPPQQVNDEEWTWRLEFDVPAPEPVSAPESNSDVSWLAKEAVKLVIGRLNVPGSHILPCALGVDLDES